MTNPPTDPNDSAFPATLGADGYGLTKREYFAAMATQGLLSLPIDCTPGQFAHDSILYADALIVELNK